MADRHPDRRQVLRALLLAGAGLAVPAACGVPTGGGPIVDGTGPASDPIGGSRVPPPDPSSATNAVELVQGFLAAVSGPLDTSDARREAGNRARKFLTAQAGQRWQPADQVTVVQVVGGYQDAVAGPGATVVTVTLRPVGVLSPRGDIGTYGGSPGPAQLAFRVVSSTADPDVPKLIDGLPPGLPAGYVLSSDALNNTNYFRPQLIYFWDLAHRFLVPDLRYVPRTLLSESAQKAAVVNWLIGGPSDLVSPVTSTILPNGTTLIGPNVVPDGQTGALVVNFSGSFQDVELDKVMAELRWSLVPLWTEPVQLQIASRPQQVDGAGTGYVADNPADAAYRSSDSEAFCVAGGVVTGVDPSSQVPAVLGASAHNQGVAKAALSRDKSQVAIVGTDRQMWLGRLRDTDARAAYVQAPLAGADWSRPAWLPNTNRVLVIVDSTLYTVNTSGGTTAVTTGVSAFSVAPDGYRIALVSGGVVSVAALRDDGDRLSIGTQRPLDPGLRNPSGVAWVRLDRLVVAGRADEGGWGLAEVSIDGAIVVPWGRPFTSEIVSVVGYPPLPSRAQQGTGPVMVQTKDGQAYRAFPTNAFALPAREPSPSPSSGTAGQVTPTAPFYLD
jgi:hypothetical protein